VESNGTAIAAAVDEQGSATQEISRNVHQAAMCIQEVAQRMSGLGDDASATKDSSVEMMAAFQRMADEANSLQQGVAVFLDSLKHAADRRMHERHPVNDTIEMTTADGHVLQAQATDLGEGGLAMRCDRALPAGDVVSVSGLASRVLKARIIASANGLTRPHFCYEPETQAAVEALIKRRFPAATARAA
jgi:methyl-accepting chemotaxis protein